MQNSRGRKSLLSVFRPWSWSFTIRGETRAKSKTSDASPILYLRYLRTKSFDTLAHEAIVKLVCSHDQYRAIRFRDLAVSTMSYMPRSSIGRRWAFDFFLDDPAAIVSWDDFSLRSYKVVRRTWITDPFFFLHREPSYFRYLRILQLSSIPELIFRH